MKKVLFAVSLLLIFVLAACGSDSSSSEGTNSEENTSPETVTYEAENGTVEVPADPQRVVVLSGYAGNVISLDVPIVGVDSWSADNPRFEDALADAEVVSTDNLEQIIELDPDLIIAGSDLSNIDKLEEIAPTVTYTWSKLDIFDQHIEIGKLLGKEEEAQAWADDFKARAAEAGEEIKAAHGEDTTVSVIETYDKDIYVYGKNWARGTEVLYQAMGMNMPEQVEKDTEQGYYALSAEVIPDYVGDYLFISKYSGSDTSFQETETYQNIPAVADGHVFEMEGETASFIDPITLDAQLAFFTESMLEE